METHIPVQVGDIVQNLISENRMTIVGVFLDPVFSLDSYHCAWFDGESYLKEACFLHKEISLIASIENNHVAIQVNDQVQLNHANSFSDPIMEVTDTIVNEEGKFALCKWQTEGEKTEVEFFPVCALKKVE
ncbi:hypothetical protein [Xanthocytophaga flava]|uniref:hypothetical protein n=1 Tax=Xanthocytophaga flava TaxID=3048013 RepID=UPI0028D4CC35|nr:hypothetical protein [Xanthocytophaga flavus]MDJ1470175.1 hypothetical protein [Xanthocytophaga flavus]